MDAQLQTSPGQSVAATENYDVNRWNEMTPEEQQKVIELSKQINVADSQSVIQYGALAQSEVSKFSDAILDQIRAKDSGEVGAVLTDLLTKVHEVDVDSLDPNKQGS